MRAMTDLQDLIGNNQAHPSGSAENLRIRKLIEAKFTALGYAPEIQKTLGCTLHYPGCTEVENIVVLHKGTGSTNDIIMLTSHYDSVPAGPAAADDGAAVVAMLEVARIIKDSPALKNDILFLITDGEEGGLRGAKAFFDQHSLMKDVKLVINLESRGVSGPSNMFETSDNNLALIQKFANTNSYPIANSLSYEIYSRLPNDTDYSIYKPSGVMGLNFAFTGDVALYHSQWDNIENLSKASLQHHGENMLGAVKAFGNIDLASLKSTTNATYIDVFGKFILHWPANFNLPISLLTLLVFGFYAYKQRPKLKHVFTSLLIIIGLFALTSALGWVLSFPLGRWPDLFYLDHPHPWPGRLAMMAAALLSAWWLAYILRNKINFNAVVWTSGLVFTCTAIGLSVSISGASYMVLIPAFGMAIGMLIDIWRKHEHIKIAAHIGLVLMAYMAFYHFIVLEVIVHYELSALRIIPLSLLGVCLLPILHKNMSAISKYFGPSLAVLTAGFAMLSFMLPGFNLKHPRMQNIVYFQGYEAGKAIWVSETSGKQDLDFTQAAGFTSSVDLPPLFGALWGKATAKQASPAKFPAPIYTLIDDTVANNIRTITMDIQSANKGYALGLGFQWQATPNTVSVNGQMAADYTQDEYNRPLALRGANDNIYRIEITTPAGRTLNMALIDSFKLQPSQLEGMAALRPAHSAPLHSGDRAHVFTPLTIDCEPHCTSEK